MNSVGATDELNVGFELYDPDQVLIEKKDPSGSGSYFGEAKLSGDYGLCLVNIT